MAGLPTPLPFPLSLRSLALIREDWDAAEFGTGPCGVTEQGCAAWEFWTCLSDHGTKSH